MYLVDSGGDHSPGPCLRHPSDTVDKRRYPADRAGKNQNAIRGPREIPNSAAAQLHIDNIFVRNVRAIEPLFENWHVIGAQQRVVKSDMHDPIADCNPFDIHVVFLTR